MKKFAIIMCLCITSSVFAQKVTVGKKSEKIKGESAEGYQTELEGTKEVVASGRVKTLVAPAVNPEI